MQTELTCGVSLMSEIAEYLSLPDIAKARASSRFVRRASEEQRGTWRPRVKQQIPGVMDCSVCSALLRTRGPLNTVHKSAAWCRLCDGLVCVDHLCRCDTCGDVFCSSCVCC